MSIKRRADTGRWRARHLGPDKKERAKDFDRKVDAERWLREQKAKVDRGDWTDPAQGRIPVGDYAQEWLRGKVKLKASTRSTYDQLLRKHIAPTWGPVPLAGVRHEAVSAWVQRLHASGLSASRTRQAYIVLAQVLDLAVKAGRIPANPARGVELPSLPGLGDRPMRALTAREVWALADEAGEDDDRLSVLVLAWCGLRFGELAGLRVRHFDVLGQELRVETALSEVGGQLIEASPKTKTSVRTVPVMSWLVGELEPLLEGKGPDDYLLTSPDGGPLRLSNWRRRVFDPALRAAGLVTDGREVVRPHDLRHTCASIHGHIGTPIKVLSVMLGHASVAITVDRYQHFYPGDVREHIDRLEEFALAARLQDHPDWGRTGTSDRLVAVPRAVGGKGP